MLCIPAIISKRRRYEIFLLLQEFLNNLFFVFIVIVFSTDI